MAALDPVHHGRANLTAEASTRESQPLACFRIHYTPISILQLNYTDTMKFVLSSAVLASVLAPAFSFSYLDSLNQANPVTHSPPGGAAGANGASYLDALNSPGSSSPSGAGIAGYLDALPTNSSPSGGAGGMSSYTNSISPSSGAPAAAAPVAAAAAPAQPYVPAQTAATPASAGSPTGAGITGYLDALGTSAGAPSGAGMTTYLDTVHRNAPVAGAGMVAYKDALPVTNTVAGTGVGMNTYTDNLSGGSKPTGSYSPFGTKPAFSGPSFSGTSSGREVGFTLEASDLSEIVQGMSGGGTLRFSGSIDSVSFN